jgi:hypothetical protein
MREASTHPVVTRALQKIREARIIEAEALSEIITAVTTADPTSTASLMLSTSVETTVYLSVKQLAARIPYAESSIRNLMLAGELVEGLHFFKRRGRVMFSWQAMQDWVEARTAYKAEAIPLVRSRRRGSSS